MATNNIKIHDVGGRNCVPTQTWQTEAAATAIAVGEPVKQKVAGSPYVIPVADAEPIIGTTTAIIGIAKSAGTHTASADGLVEVFMIDKDTVLKAAAKSAAAADTAAEVLALQGKRILFDLTSSVYTVDTAVADANVNGLKVLGGDPATSEIYFIVRDAALESLVA